MDVLIKKDIEKDFYNCLGAFKNFYTLMNTFPNLEINDTDSEEEKNIKQAQIDDLLVQLGRIGELAFKYLLKLKQTELHSNWSYEQFLKQPIFAIGSIKDLATKGKIAQSDADEIISFHDPNNQKAHNFAYLGLVTKKLMSDTYSNFEKIIDYSFQTQAVLQVLRNMDNQHFDWEIRYGSYGQLVIFPCLIWTDFIDIDAEKLQRIVSKLKDKANSSGDIFTRFRYFSNNTGDKGSKQYNMNDVIAIFSYIKSLVIFVTGIHKNNGGLLTNPESIFGREQALKYPKLTGRNPDEINSIFEEFLNDDPLDLCEKLFSGYRIDELKKIEQLCKEYGLSSYMVIQHGIYSDELILLHGNGCDDYLEMQDYVFDEALNRRTLQEIELLVQKGNVSSTNAKK